MVTDLVNAAVNPGLITASFVIVVIVVTVTAYVRVTTLVSDIMPAHLNVGAADGSMVPSVAVNEPRT